MADSSTMRNNPLAVAARYNDADAEEKGFTEVFPALDLEMDDVIYVAQQRALRVVTGIHVSTNKAIPVPKLTMQQAEQMVTLTSCVLDGIVIGWRAHRISKHDAYTPPTHTAAVDLVRGILSDFSAEESEAILRDVMAIREDNDNG